MLANRLQGYLRRAPRPTRLVWFLELALAAAAAANCGKTDEDESAGSWTFAAPMIQGRMGHSATRLASGRILVAGGADSKKNDHNSGYSFSFIATAELYNPDSNTWTHAASMATARGFHSATLLQSGKVLVQGSGFSSCLADNCSGVVGGVELYDPERDIWTEAPAPSVLRTGCHHVKLLDGRIMAIGGIERIGKPRAFTNVDIYDPESNTWVEAAPLLEPRTIPSSAILLGGEVLVFGGLVEAGTSTEIYEPLTNAWRPGPPTLVPHTFGFSTGRQLPSGEAVLEDEVESSEIYSPITGGWRLAKPSPIDISSLSILAGGHLLVVGEIYNPRALVFDPSADTWREADRPSAIGDLHQAGTLPSGEVLLSGGIGDCTATDEFSAATTVMVFTPH